MATFQLCWDCKKALGGCPWSDSFKPVEGWGATKVNKSGAKPYDTYSIYSCPEFERDAYDGGQKREKRVIKLR